MKLGTILLGTAAGLMAVTGAQAADLPGEAVPAAVDYVKVCDAFGAGFFYIPGTETCLDISGRVRFRTQYDHTVNDADTLRFRADARVDFDVRTATEYGNLRTFVRLGDELNESFDDPNAFNQDDNGVELDLAFIQLGYVTVGIHGDIANGDVLYGDQSAAYLVGDDDLLGVSVLADDLGGGFYAGVGIYSSRGGRDNILWGEDDDGDDFADATFMGVVGIADQAWGGIDLSAAYRVRAEYTFPGGETTNGVDYFTIKATANLALAEGFDARLVAAYADTEEDNTDAVTLAGAVAYAFSDAATVYTGIRYDIVDGDDILRANLGVDYTIVSDLILTGEVAYADDGDEDAFTGLVQLTRNW